MWRSLNILLLLLITACGVQGKPMTPAEVQAYGTARFEAPAPVVFKAVQEALKVEGYEIASADAAKGSIKTNRKLVRAVAVGNQYQATAVEITRQYVIKLEQDGKETVVSAEPRVFQGDQDLSASEVWDLESPTGERALWQQLFRDTKEAL